MEIFISTIKSILGSSSIKYILTGVLSAFVLFLCWHFITKHYYDNGYTDGKNEQVLVYKNEQEKLKDIYSKELEEKDKERDKLNKEIADLKEQYATLKGKRKNSQDKIDEEVDKYEKNGSNDAKCLDTEWLRIYKNSLPE